MKISGSLVVVLLILACCFVVPVLAQPWCGIQQLFFQNQTSPEPTNYQVLSDSPSGLSEVDKSITITSANGSTNIVTFISPIGYPGVTSIRKGLRTYNMYHYVSSSTGVTVATYTMFIRHQEGTEDTIYSFGSGDIDALTITKYSTQYVSPEDIPLATTDRVGVRVNGMTSGSTPITLHFVYEGSVHNSNIDTGYFECPQTLQGIYVSSVRQVFPIYIAIAAIVLACFIIAYKKRKE